MQIGMVGLGRMGANMAARLRERGGIEVHGFDPAEAARASASALGVSVHGSLDELVHALEAPRVVWLMVPAALTSQLVDELGSLLAPDDVVVDGGNGFYRDDVTHAATLAARGIHHLDVGTSGGVWGRERGYCLMIGGDPDVFARLEPAFAALAPGVDAAPRTRADVAVGPEEQGYLLCGPHGAGHFVKMVHNGIEYGLMAAFAEGFSILEHANAGSVALAADAETAPMREPDAYRYELDVAKIAELWRRGSVVGSWLLDLAARALADDPHLEQLEGRVADSGEGRWTVLAAIDETVPAPVIASALFARYASRGEDAFANRVLSALRREFGGHEERRP
ncbi:6-phosphogluconate dehydrogenase, decarboxylating [Acidimicrobium ferrooxidans DSM 10331]|uniref:6-phosphogluconate dehydrogenase, decarboxylating n=1 Tax=Acidimicrobium ferrooxidans (strain DSM 10331 / JCM 15462 / NBRC 103882 / ICP) TaxID=525909 RepID=C7LZ68_ACIFD|nr:decarboxylating 6-phosphogluconate dehydrogenase [Acidimicrobium ferrooxidans]ACU54026.1 6-phosphogluconate dehydrogenase, decarboxylating [Acidimicrobium ferrooxidans DSM 10331]